MEIGGAMGWTPSDVRAARLADVFAALDGWLAAQGAEQRGFSDDEIQEALALMEAHS